MGTGAYDVRGWDNFWYGLIGIEHYGDGVLEAKGVERKKWMKGAVTEEFYSCCEEYLRQQSREAGIKKISVSSRYDVKLGESMLHAWVLKDLAGLIRKDNAHTWIFGRETCERLKEQFGCNGYFTSDEVPGGVNNFSRRDLENVYRETGAGERDLILMFAYERESSEEMARYLVQTFSEVLGLEVERHE